MVRVERIRKLIPSGNGIHHAVLDLQVSTVAELPALGSKVEGMVIDAGSIAELIQACSYPTLDADGKWYVDGAEVS